ncbi:zinc-binding dehydrogenase [Tessaracoccus oleiagri]|uniref:Alcohol dehydrogenase n=1 Tax=Tessaracoccus oleiagri TaxID=686624 RepID=A0A1G9LPA8_9ACTN|nr:zinc-binding dehydrogenase [Tessaracoccus oleiagri]SDL63859.1 alcohol dehydrogenase [Tessaracoccus oleiagri]
MRAVTIPEHGNVEALRVVEDHPRPIATEGHVVVKVRASSLNYHDIFTLRGMPGITIPMPVVPGLDIAGEVDEVGAGVEGWEIGDRVLVHPINSEGKLMGEVVDGGLAQYSLVEAGQLIRLPDAVSFTEAAALPVAYGTAHRMIVDKQTIKAGDKVLVLGASGGVGTASVLLAKRLGAYVVAAAGSDEKGRQLLELGADEFINYREQDFYAWTKEHLGKPSRTSYEGGFDVIVNNTGGDTWHPTLRSTKRGGSILVCGATAGFDPTEDLRYIWSFELRIIGSNGFDTPDFESLLRYVEEGDFHPVIDSVVGLDDAVDAFRRLEGRQVFGKIVVDPWLEA